jgi:transcriptional regulator with XRE-family HTH domain
MQTNLGKTLQFIREYYRFTQEEAGSLFTPEVSASQVSVWERGDSGTRLSTLQRYADTFDLKLSVLFKIVDMYDDGKSEAYIRKAYKNYLLERGGRKC